MENVYCNRKALLDICRSMQTFQKWLPTKYASVIYLSPCCNSCLFRPSNEAQALLRPCELTITYGKGKQQNF